MKPRGAFQAAGTRKKKTSSSCTPPRRGEKAIDIHVSLLADAVCSVLRLKVQRWVPVGVEDDHSVGGGDVEPHAPRASGQEEDEQTRALVEVVHQTLALSRGRGTVQAAKHVPPARVILHVSLVHSLDVMINRGMHVCVHGQTLVVYQYTM